MFDSNLSDLFDIQSGVKQGCILAPTPLLSSLPHSYLQTRLDNKLFNFAQLRASKKFIKLSSKTCWLLMMLF